LPKYTKSPSTRRTRKGTSTPSAAFSLLPVSPPIAERFAEIRAHLRRRGELLADFDILVAATALHHDLTLLTFNARHFRRIPDLRLFPPS
jgi:predicted nucleic acid-binding protein